MKDSTKHIVARELAFFFKWALRALIALVVLGVIAAIISQIHFEKEPYLLEDIGTVLAYLFVFTPLIAYLCRGIVWLVAWVKKWK